MLTRGLADSSGRLTRMFENKTKVLLILPQDALDRARVLAGEATTTLKLPGGRELPLYEPRHPSPLIT